MYGGSGKLGRGGGGAGRGGGVGKRNIQSPFQPPPFHRASPSPSGRLPVGSGAAAPRNRNMTSCPTSSAPSNGVEETFSLVTGNRLNYAMIIRLAPDLVEEIKRLETEGGAARIKFDANANSDGNVINVGRKDFRFTCSREPGDLCDIYEERQSGEDGNGLLVESGGAWRKLNVQRVLDESFTNHVKMRSEEAEKKLKSRKAIVLDHANPSMKGQTRVIAAPEANPRKMNFKQKKEPPLKKRKAEPPPGGSYGSAYKSGLSATTNSKGKPSASPLSSPPEPSGAPASPFGNVNLLKGQIVVDDMIPTQTIIKATSSDKEIPGKAITSSVQDKVGRKSHTGTTSTDLRSMLISLLMENQSKGISLKALEKAVGDTLPNSAKQIEPIIKKIAIYQAPGRYFLKPEVDIKSFPKPAPESGSSPEDHCQPSSAPHKFDQLPAPQTVLVPKTDSGELEEGAVSDSKPQEACDAIENIDILHLSPDRSEGQANSSSSSSSDSESSDSGSDSGSQSRSQSKSVASGSSSDSESDASSNSKEASDEDVDIMSDDDKETNHKLQASEQLQCGTLDFEPGQFEVGEIEDLNVVDIVDIEKDLPDGGQVAEMDVIPDLGPMRDDEKPVKEIRPFSADWHAHKQREVQMGKLPREAENVSYQNHSSEIESIDKDSFKREPSHSVQKSQKSKTKRVRDEKHSVDKGDKHKRVKTQNPIQQQSSGGRNSTFVESSHLSPDKDDRTSRDAAGDFGSQKSYNQAMSRKSASEFLQPDRRSVDFSARGKTPSGSERPIKQGESSGHTAKYTERSLQMNEGFPLQRDKVSKDSQDEYGIVSDKRERKNPKDGVGDQHRTSVDSNLNKYDSPLPGNSPKDNMGNTGKSSFINGRGHMLQRELSDLELGELREPPTQETAGSKKQVERKSSFKGENRPSSSDYWNFESSKGRTVDKTVADLRRSSPLQLSSVHSGTPDGLSKRRTPEWHAEDFSRSHQKVAQPQPQQHRPRINQNDIGSQYNQPVDMHSSRQIEEEGSLGTGQDVHADNRRKSSVGTREQHDLKQSVLPPSVKQNKGQKSSLAAEINDRHKDASLLGSCEGQRMQECSPDEMSSYSKYEKEEPELKGPIENFAQYEEYVQEYREKYDSYCSINKILESYRNEFIKLGKELDVSKGRDTKRFYDMLGQLKDSYRKCGPRHVRLKKIFIVLHEELKYLKQMIKDFAVSYARDR
ncbi:uncharacterized protein LOC125857921 [Solanum stenotomum]|uniref:uncharacterized protein LOC125857921 n=1 Tax=Solanum stenotomum TaxID=172797 RepID=UPI0020D11D1B|nr:uncharacterized protein LOC125857921 [Solanum stenotomum]